MMYICLWYMLISCVWVHASLCGCMPEENTGVLICHCQSYSFETGSFSDFGAGVAISKPCRLPCLCPPPCYCYSHAHGHAQISLCGCWDLKSGLHTCEQVFRCTEPLFSSNEKYLSVYHEPQGLVQF